MGIKSHNMLAIRSARTEHVSTYIHLSSLHISSITGIIDNHEMLDTHSHWSNTAFPRHRKPAGYFVLESRQSTEVLSPPPRPGQASPAFRAWARERIGGGVELLQYSSKGLSVMPF